MIEFIVFGILLLVCICGLYYTLYGDLEYITGLFFDMNNKNTKILPSKYNLSLCCCILTQTSPETYIEQELIPYYTKLGVVHFYIYSICEIPVINDYCTIMVFPEITQLNAYNHCIHTFGNETNWLFMVDENEMIELPPAVNTLTEYLQEFEKNGTQAVIINVSMEEEGKPPKTIFKPNYTLGFVDNSYTVVVEDSRKYITPTENKLIYK
jgi:hypothetical protein